VVFLLLDHQAGLFQVVKDISVAELRANTAMLATLLKSPVVTTASVPEGPNGPLMPEIHQFAPHSVHVQRKGEVNAWDNELFVKTADHRRRLDQRLRHVPGVGCDGSGVQGLCGDRRIGRSQRNSRTTLARFVQAGVVPISANAVLCEL
jgi:hypothetical protein